ncbi:MAG: HNH endonuclease [Alphaproteobacteria bacterium]
MNELRRLYEGRCQLCLWQPRKTYGEELCEAHHVRWLARGGDDELHNLVLVCPNHHRAIHRCDSPFDHGTMSFHFEGFSERLGLDLHELRA